jgi:hypothetical protein
VSATLASANHDQATPGSVLETLGLRDQACRPSNCAQPAIDDEIGANTEWRGRCC